MSSLRAVRYGFVVSSAAVSILVSTPAPVIQAIAETCNEIFWVTDLNVTYDVPRSLASATNPRQSCESGPGFAAFSGGRTPDGSYYGLLTGCAFTEPMWGRFDPAGTNGVFYTPLSLAPVTVKKPGPGFLPDFPASGQPLGYRFHPTAATGVINSLNPLRLYAVDSLMPYSEHLVSANVGLVVGNFGLGTVVSQDGSKVWYVTTDAVYQLDLVSGGPPAQTGFLSIYRISRNAVITAASQDGEFMLFDGGAGFYYQANGDVISSLLPPLSQIVDAGMYPCTPGGMRIEPHAGLVTTESGGTATFTAVLTAPPAQDVTVAFASTDTTEGTISPASATFTSANWSTPQTITVTGVADSDTSDQAFRITTSALTSADPNFAGRVVLDVDVTNTHVNQPPAITSASPAVQQGAVAATITLATVADLESAANTLTVETTSPAVGITVGAIEYAGGTVSAPVAAACAATLGGHAMTLRATDPNTAFSDASISITVTANLAPSLGTYPTASATPGGGAVATASAAPADFGTVTSVTVASETFTGSLSVNQSNGSVSVSNAGPVGTHLVTVTATDNCGATTARSFMLGVSTFTDAVLSAGVTVVSAGHVTELRERIDALRVRAGLSPFAWTTPSLVAGETTIRAQHVDDLRTALAQAYAAGSQTPPSYTDGTIAAGSTAIRAVHFTELRAAVVVLESLLN